METNVKVLFFFSFAARMLTQLKGEGMGPFEMNILSVGRCSPELLGKDLLKYDIRMQRVSRKNLILHANASFEIPFGDDLDIKMRMAKYSNQGWKDNFFNMDLPKACSSMKTYVPSVMKDLAEQFKLKRKDCPVPPGNYTVALNLNINMESIPVFTYNKYRSRAFLYRGEDIVFCSEAISEVVPKRKG